MNTHWSALLLIGALALAGCNGDDQAGGESGTPQQNISEAEPAGVGGTSNK